MSQSLGIYETRDGFERIVPFYRDRLDCVVDFFRDGGLDLEDAEVTEAGWSVVSFPSFGDSTDAFRITLEIADDFSIDAHYDFVFITRGRVVFVLATVDAFSPFDTRLLEQLAERAVERIDARISEDPATATLTPAEPTSPTTSSRPY